MTVTERKRRNSPHQPVGRWIRPAKRLEIYWRDDFRCLHCGRDLAGARRRNITLDHAVPRSLGGNNTAFNVFTACRDCNSRRGAAPLSREAFHRIAKSILIGATWAIEGIGVPPMIRRLNPCRTHEDPAALADEARRVSNAEERVRVPPGAPRSRG